MPKTIIYVFAFTIACLGLSADAKYVHKGCQNLELKGNVAQVAAAAGEVGVVSQMRKQREERVQCNLDCRLRTGTLNPSSTSLLEYFMTFPYFVWAPAVLFVLCLLVFPCWVCCRCCSRCCRLSECCCCFLPQKSKKYTKFQKNIVVIFYLIFALGTVICAGIGFASGSGFGNSILEATCQFDHTRYSAKTIMDRIFLPAKQINALIPGIISDVNTESDAAMAKRDGRLTSDAQKKLIDDMRKFHLYAAQVYQYKCGNPSINTQGNYSCEICVLKHAQSVEDTITKVDELTKEPAKKVKEDREAVTQFIILAGSAITSTVKQFTDGLKFVVDFLDEGGPWDTAGNEAIQYAGQVKGGAPTTAVVPFAVLLLGIVLTILGLILLRVSSGSIDTGKPSCIGVCGGYCVGFSWCSGCLSILVLLLLSQIMWPFLFVMTDTCIILDKAPTNLAAYIPLGSYESSMLQSCFNNVTVLPPGATSSDNSTGGLDFSSSVKFSSVQDVNEIDNVLDVMFDWPWLDINETNMVNAMAVNLSRTSNSAGQCLNNRTNALFKLKDMFANITAEKRLFKKYFNISYRSMGKIQELTQPMFRVGDIMKQGFKCGEVGSAYYDMSDILCGNMLESISNLVTSWFLAAFFGMILAYLGIKINQRLGGHGRPEHYETEDGSDDAGDFEMQTNNYSKSNFTSI